MSRGLQCPDQRPQLGPIPANVLGAALPERRPKLGDPRQLRGYVPADDVLAKRTAHEGELGAKRRQFGHQQVAGNWVAAVDAGDSAETKLHPWQIVADLIDGAVAKRRKDEAFAATDREIVQSDVDRIEPQGRILSRVG